MAAESEYVRVRVHRAVSIGGEVHRPKIDGKKTTPVEATVLRSEARPFNGSRLEILGEAPDPNAGSKQETPPADKQVTGARDK